MVNPNIIDTLRKFLEGCGGRSIISWVTLPSGSWFIDGEIKFDGPKGIGTYQTSYVIDGSLNLLNGFVTAKIWMKNWRSDGASLISWADELWSLVAAYVAPPAKTADYTTLRISVFKRGRFTPVAALREPVRLDGGYCRFSLGCFSGNVWTEIRTTQKMYDLSCTVPHLAFPGAVGLIRFYNTSLAVKGFDCFDTVLHRQRNELLPKTLKYDAFISHSSGDNAVVLEIVEQMKAHGISYWVDQEQITFGDQITAKIEDGLRHSKTVVVLLSKNLKQGRWVRAEYGAFLNSELAANSPRRVIPLQVDDVGDDDIPPLLRDRARALYRDKKNFEAFLASLKG